MGYGIRNDLSTWLISQVIEEDKGGTMQMYG